MKIERSKDWWTKYLQDEEDTAIGAGAGEFVFLTQQSTLNSAHAADTTKETKNASDDFMTSADETTRLGFSRFVNLMRRKQSLSIEQLAEKAKIEASELLNIEDDLHHLPDPRAVFQLSQFFHVPQRALMQLAGVIVPKDSTFRREVVRFAARSEPIRNLSPEEDAALEAFIGVLAARDLKKNS